MQLGQRFFDWVVTQKKIRLTIEYFTTYSVYWAFSKNNNLQTTNAEEEFISCFFSMRWIGHKKRPISFLK